MTEAARKRVAVFAPSLVLTVSIEDHGEGPDVHVHAGGQGLWQARLLEALGIDAVLATALIGEPGQVLGHLLREHEGVDLAAIEVGGRGAAYIHDLRQGERTAVVETEGEILTRHDLDELYGLALRIGLETEATILSGPAGERVLPADHYRRLAADLRTAGRTVVADLAGERLTAVLEGGVDVLKVSDEELVADGLAEDRGDDAVRRALHHLVDSGATTAIVTREGARVLALGPDGMLEVQGPTLQVVDSRGAGDSLTAAVTAALVHGADLPAALRLGAAAGAVNVTRRGLGSADPATIRAIEHLVEVRAVTA